MGSKSFMFMGVVREYEADARAMRAVAVISVAALWGSTWDMSTVSPIVLKEANSLWKASEYGSISYIHHYIKSKAQFH